MKALVIGATGTLGSAVADALAARHEVVRAARSGQVHADMTDAASVDRLVEEVGPVEHPVRVCDHYLRELHHPLAGRLTLYNETLLLPDDCQRLGLFYAESDSPSAAGLKLLTDLATASAPQQRHAQGIRVTSRAERLSQGPWC
ncbi:NAD-dependent epimerase/dehydratase family protein [Nonomuraea mesophila]|uniref:NAD-dependent epimerase/dehydratase family protein n=1 Tax=Nonomuraea mesophila TaxID=2530382 RepID=A0A4R5FAF3_9ACTN|nr:NAD-dependent epimerase/dehydratase family protein [Nonomuraea mesophila]TDE45166.1 NAD-dependent epimerase/dehydratase family protein [Nonomuraea mesophila]